MAVEQDIVLIYMDGAPVSFARIEDIRPDVKKDWFVIKLLLLQIPLQVVSWILKAEYINGENFAMNGQSMRLEKVECPEASLPEDALDETSGETGANGETTAPASSGGKVVSLAGHRSGRKK